jgi:mannosyltransferase OCH1-like enzyme
MLHFGGIYIDLDNVGIQVNSSYIILFLSPLTLSLSQGCRTNLEPLLYYPVMVADGLVGALSNNILSARPNHPFWILLTQSLQEYDWNYVLPYVVVSYASGQWLEMIMWERYHNMLPAISASNKNTNTTNNNNNINIYNINTQKEHRLYRMALDWRDADSWVFFTMGPGGSWHDWDTGFFRWIGDHLVLLAVGTGLALGVAAWTCARTVRMLQKRVYGGRGKYQPIKGGGADLGRV